MHNLKVCVDIGGTKIIFAVLDDKLKIKKSIYIPTPLNLNELLNVLNVNLSALKNEVSVANIGLAGRVDKKGKVILCPNLPLKGINLKKLVKRYFKEVHIDNDANCFALYHMFRGRLKNSKNAMALVWGTGVGGAIITNGILYRGRGLAAELGHMKALTEPEKDIESLVGGKRLKETYGHSGSELYELAKRGDVSAINSFMAIGQIFGRYLASLMNALDPELIVLGGSFVNSWGFIKTAVEKAIKTESLRGNLRISISSGRFYVIKGCYFLDEYEKHNNKL